MKRFRFIIAASALAALLPFLAAAQKNIIINLAPIDGIQLTPDNIFGYQVQCTGSGNVVVRGIVRYRNSNLSMSYSFNCMLRQGINMMNAGLAHPQWQFSSPALQELFSIYKILPEGTFEYCVTVTPSGVKENTPGSFEECLYYRPEDIFLINLVDPENNAKLHEFNPMLSWVANYSFSNELAYRVRVAEIKQGQNPANAVMRNQPVFDESNLMQSSIIYPVYAKPLEANKPYAWTVDAYYRGILLGGAETWRFIIPDDTLPANFPVNRSFIDIKRENGAVQLYVAGELKIKYTLEKTLNDVLSLQLVDGKKEPVGIKPGKLAAAYGDNRYHINLKDSCNLKHLNNYSLIIKSKAGDSYTLPFKYVDPDYIH